MAKDKRTTPVDEQLVSLIGIVRKGCPSAKEKRSNDSECGNDTSHT